MTNFGPRVPGGPGQLLGVSSRWTVPHHRWLLLPRCHAPLSTLSAGCVPAPSETAKARAKCDVMPLPARQSTPAAESRQQQQPAAAAAAGGCDSESRACVCVCVSRAPREYEGLRTQ